MLGYTISDYLLDKNNFYFNELDDKRINGLILKGIALSGGNNIHYEILKQIFIPSFIKETGEVLYDIRASEMLLFKFPFILQVLLAYINYKENDSLLKFYNKNYSTKTNILKIKDQLYINNLISNSSLDDKLLNRILINECQLNTSVLEYLFDIELNVLSELEKPNTYLNKLNYLFNMYEGKLNKVDINNYLEIAKDNNRIKTVLLILDQLNYKQASINNIISALNVWQSQNSSI